MWLDNCIITPFFVSNYMILTNLNNLQFGTERICTVDHGEFKVWLITGESTQSTRYIRTCQIIHVVTHMGHCPLLFDAAHIVLHKTNLSLQKKSCCYLSLFFVQSVTAWCGGSQMSWILSCLCFSWAHKQLCRPSHGVPPAKLLLDLSDGSRSKYNILQLQLTCHVDSKKKKGHAAMYGRCTAFVYSCRRVD